MTETNATPTNPTTTQGTLQVIEDACTFTTDKSGAKIVIQSNLEPFPSAIEELDKIDVRNLALGYAASKGVADPRVNGNVIGPYPVNAKGINVYDATGPNKAELPPNHEDKQPVAYRADVPVCRKLV